jgi:ABC-2 type transport system permease protein
VIAFYLLKIPLRGSFWLAYILVILQSSLVALFMGTFLACAFNDETTANLVFMPIFFIFLMISGIFVPIESMPGPLRKVGYFMPQTYACIALRDIITKGWHLSSTAVLLGFISSGLWCFVLFAGSIAFLHYNL